MKGKGKKVIEKMERMKMNEIEMKEGEVMEKGWVYIVKIMERIEI